MICSEFRELLDNYESITDEQRIEMEKHTAECENCRKEFEFFKSIMNNLASIPSLEAPKTLIDKVNAQLDEEKTVVVGFRWNLRILSTVAACLAIGLAVGINNGYIEKNIKEKDSGGVIAETVVSTQETEAPQAPVETQDTDAVVSEVKVEAEEVLPTKSVEQIAPVAEPVKQPQKTVNPAKNDKKPVKVASVPTQAPAKTSEPEKVISNEAKNEGTSDIPIEKEPADKAPVQVPEDKNNVDDYAIKDEGYQIAYGKYDVESGKRTTNAFSDYLHVQSDDMGAVVSTMSEMGVRNSGGYYMTSRRNFYALMNTLNDKGVGYECDLQYNSGENISFRLTYN